jgi:hypothetical protein
VYEIVVKQKGDGGKRRYVGESDDLRRRFSEHLRDDERNECVRDYVKNYNTFFRYAQEFPNEEDRKDIEKALYDRYKHRCNSEPYGHAPSGSGRNVVVKLTEIPPDQIVTLP